MCVKLGKLPTIQTVQKDISTKAISTIAKKKQKRLKRSFTQNTEQMFSLWLK